MSEDIKKPGEEVEPKNEEISAEDLENVTGGNVNNFSLVKKVDKATPKLHET